MNGLNLFRFRQLRIEVKIAFRWERDGLEFISINLVGPLNDGQSGRKISEQSNSIKQ